MSTAEPPVSVPSTVGGGRLVRWGAVAALATGAALLGILLAVREMVDAETLERRLEATLRSGTEGDYQVEVDAVGGRLLRRSLHLEGVRLRLESITMGGKVQPHHVRLSIRDVTLQGIDPWALFWGRFLEADRVRVREPRLALRPTERARRRDAAISDDTTTGGGLSGVRTRHLSVEGGTLIRERPDHVPVDSLWGLTLRLRGLSTDSMAGTAPARYLARRFVHGTADGYRRRIRGAPYRLRVGDTQISRPDSVFRAAKIRFGPTLSDEAFARQHEYRVNRFHTTAEQITAVGSDLSAFIERGAVRTDRLQIDDLTLDVYRNNRRPESPEDPPPLMPQEAVNRLNRSVCIDTLRLRNSRIRYTKRPEGSTREGSIRFETLWASAYNLTNDPGRMTAASPAVIKTRSRVNGAGRLHTTFRIPLRAPNLSLSFRGRLGETPAPAFNDPFVPLGGVRIESGMVDSLWFAADVERGTATGTIGGIYRNLEVEILDEDTGDRGLVERVKTTVTGLALREDNHPSEGGLEKGEINHTRRSEESFFKFLWHALRDGIYSLIGIDRLPR